MCDLVVANDGLVLIDENVSFYKNDDVINTRDLEKYNKSVKSKRLQNKKHLDQNRNGNEE